VKDYNDNTQISSRAPSNDLPSNYENREDSNNVQGVINDSQTTPKDSPSIPLSTFENKGNSTLVESFNDNHQAPINMPPSDMLLTDENKRNSNDVKPCNHCTQAPVRAPISDRPTAYGNRARNSIKNRGFTSSSSSRTSSSSKNTVILEEDGSETQIKAAQADAHSRESIDRPNTS
jgi:hypothetical protein